MNKNLWIATVAVLVIAIGGYLFPKVTIPFGAVSGPDIQSDYLNVNGVVKQYRSIPMTKATSTPCTQLVTATSTLDRYAFTVSSSTSVTATQFVLATSTLQNATTTIITAFGQATSTNALPGWATTTVAASGKTTLVYVSNGNQVVISPNTYLTLGVQGGLGNFGTAAQVGGVCKSVLTEVTGD